ncbi:class F sortase [Kineococcus gypseus]|uniref:class F sortase n=1 Tax=Kineococcus gypseus TaxID=1637102 RepID=UPI003D7D1AC2
MRSRARRALPVACALLGAGLLGGWWAERPAAGFGDVVAAAPAAPTAAAGAGPGAGGPDPGRPLPAAPAGPAGLALPRVAARPAAPAPPVPVVAPVALRVPDLGVDAPVVDVGVAPDGGVEVPERAWRVGWYRFGPVPGAPGSAVVVGHVDTVRDGPGALHPLAGAEAGQRVEVVLADGSVRAFAVTARQRFVKEELPVAELFARTGPARLVLVTCGGEFDRRTRSYEENVVVVAEPVP